MPFQLDLEGELPQITAPACIHLRSKSMYVHGRRGEAEHPAEPGTGTCWCNTTQHYVGPDQEYVTRFACISGRGCYRESY